MTASPQRTSAGTQAKILDAAERLFGANGFDATSLRHITAEARVNLAAVNYHFRSKESLMDAVIERRLAPVNRRRMEMLDAAGSSPTVEQIVAAFVSPLFVLDILPALPLMGRVLSNPNQFVERVYKKHLVQVVQRFSAAMGAALPELPPEERFWKLQFMAGSMTHVLALSGVLPLMSGQALDRNALKSRLIAFLAAGLRAPVAAASPPSEEK
jgi:AcrR family transcriptional regulator